MAVLIGGAYYYQYEYVPNQRLQAEETAKVETARALEEQISGLLSAASEDMSRDRLTSPAGANAREKYQAVLALEPGHKMATAGLDSIIGRYVSKFDASLRRKKFSEAEGYISRIERVYADAPVLSGLGDRLSGAREEEQRVGRHFKDCAECPEMVVVPSGSFTMGASSSEAGRDDEGPHHRVAISYPFAVGVYEVTFSEWEACVNAGGCGGYVPDDEGWGRGNRPVISVSWDDAQSYVRWLSQKTGHRYSLLSESEWEYVARAGTETAFYFGSTISTDQANYNGNYIYGGGRKGVYRRKTVPVGSFRSNAWGVYDMHGNVWEWVEDCWNDSYVGAPTDGSAWESGNCARRVVRGGSWFSGPWHLRSALRDWFTSENRSSINGFRVLRRF